MPFITWENSLCTGIEQFDEHHRHLVDLLNKTYDDFICAAPDEEIAAIINELLDYAAYHFAAEEAWMQQSPYPKLLEHAHEHTTFSQTITSFKNEFDNGNVNISLEVLTFLKKWLRHHILESDADYGKYKTVALN